MVLFYLHIRFFQQGRTPLHYAAFLRDGGEVYQFLLAAGSDERAMDVVSILKF